MLALVQKKDLSVIFNVNNNPPFINMAINFQELYCLGPKPIEFITFSALDTTFSVLFKSDVAQHHQLEPHTGDLEIIVKFLIIIHRFLAVLLFRLFP